MTMPILDLLPRRSAWLLCALAGFAAGPSQAQSNPQIGSLPDAFEMTPGVTAYLHPEGNPDVTVFRYDHDDGTIVVDGRRATVRPSGRARTETAFDQSAGVTRTYDVQVWRPRDRSFEVEVWERSVDDGGGDCMETVGGLTVRKRGRQTHLRIEGQACQF